MPSSEREKNVHIIINGINNAQGPQIHPLNFHCKKCALKSAPRSENNP